MKNHREVKQFRFASHKLGNTTFVGQLIQKPQTAEGGILYLHINLKNHTQTAE